jgi:hypothetical protein
MIVDIHLRFEGFGNSEGHCHVRFCRPAIGKPLVIVASQYLDYLGASVTNAAETIIEKVFYLVANREVERVRFDFPLPLYEEWDADVNMFDRVLCFLSPHKYRDRFSRKKLDIQAIHEKVIWIEHHPGDNRGGLAHEARIFHVKLDEHGRPQRSHPSAPELYALTGVMKEDLLPESPSLPEAQGSDKARRVFQSAEVKYKRLSLHSVRWTADLVAALPSLLASDKAYKGTDDEAEEQTIHELIVRFFATRLPAPDRLRKNYPFPESMFLHARGRPKHVDFVLFDAEGHNIDAALEVKRTSKSKAFRAAVQKDIARLLLASRFLQCACYFLIVGDAQVVLDKLARTEKYLSFADDETDRDRFFDVVHDDFDAEYQAYLSTARISEGSSRLQGMKVDETRIVALWQISAMPYALSLHRPYRYEVKKVRS